MKKIILLLMFMIFAVSLVLSSELNTKAQTFKKISPEGYKIVKATAIEKWGTDHSMIVYEINKQCDSFFEVLLLLDEKWNWEVFVNAIAKWTNHEAEFENLEILKKWSSKEAEITILLILDVNWSMVLYEYKKQITAINSY